MSKVKMRMELDKEMDSERFSNYTQIRKAIMASDEIYITAVFNDGADVRNMCGDSLSIPVSKTYALDLYKGLSGQYWGDNGATAVLDMNYCGTGKWRLDLS